MDPAADSPCPNPMYTGLDNDSLIVVFANLPLAEKLKCRLVCRQWAVCIDKLISGQQQLEIYGANQAAVAAAAEASGQLDYGHASAGGGGGAAGQLVRRLLPERVMRPLRHFWWQLNSKLSSNAATGPSGDMSPRVQPITPTMAVHEQLEAAAAAMEPLAELWPESASVARRTPLSALDLIHMSSYYWTYAFCSSSSLFSSYSFANSSLTGHEYYHSFCACYARQRHKYSLVIDRASLSLELLSNALAKFSNIQHLVVRNLDQLSDVLLLLITCRCRKLHSLSFINCTSLATADPTNRHATLNQLTGKGTR